MAAKLRVRATGNPNMSTELKLTVAEYDAMVAKGAFDDLQKRIELINGVIRQMNPAGPVHDDLIEYLTQWSVRNTNQDEIRVRIQSGLSLPELHSRPEPDVLWVQAGNYRDRQPVASDVLLLIEVANSSLAFDREAKARLYSQAGISEYWIVNATAEAIHVFRQPSPDGYRSLTTVEKGTAIAPLAKQDAVLDPDKRLRRERRISLAPAMRTKRCARIRRLSAGHAPPACTWDTSSSTISALSWPA